MCKGREVGESRTRVWEGLNYKTEWGIMAGTEAREVVESRSQRY